MPARLWITVSPGARVNEIELRGDGLWVRIAAPATEGKANAELIAYLAKKLAVSKSRVAILKGASGRRKLIAVEGIDEGDVWRRLGVGS